MSLIVADRWDFPSPYPMKFRVVRVLLDTGEYETLATSLPRTFTPAEIKELYHARWGIETAFRELKYGMGWFEPLLNNRFLLKGITFTKVGYVLRKYMIPSSRSLFIEKQLDTQILQV